jgi:internalin A
MARCCGWRTTAPWSSPTRSRGACASPSPDRPPGRRRLLAVVRTDFERIHAGYKFQPQEMVPVPGRPDVLVPYDELLVYEKEGVATVPKVVDGKILQIGVRDLLDGIDVAGSRPRAASVHPAREAARVVVSYSHKDELFRDELETQLKLLQRQRLIALWTDRRIDAGDEWKRAIDDNFERADLVLLLVSADFINSDFCYEIEMQRALERHAEGSARVVPIIVRDVAWSSAPFAKLQVLPGGGKAVVGKGKGKLARDTAWKGVAEALERILRSNPPRGSLPADALAR